MKPKLFLFLAVFFVFLTLGCLEENMSDNASVGNSVLLSSSEQMIQDQLNQRIENTNSTNPEYFKKFETDPATIAIFNEVPLLGGRAAYSWGESLYSIAKTIQNDDNFTNYLEEHGGPLTGYAVSTDYMLIYVAPEKRNELTSEDIKIIMEIINQAAADHGVENVPVVFHASRIEISGLDYTLDS